MYHIYTFAISPSPSLSKLLRKVYRETHDLLDVSESDKFREMAVATESPPKGGFQFNDDQEYPPLNQKSD